MLYHNAERDDERSNYLQALVNFGGQASIPFYKELVEVGADENHLHTALRGIGGAGGEENIAFLTAYSRRCLEGLRESLESALVLAEPKNFDTLKHLAAEGAEERRDACMFLARRPQPEAKYG